MSVFPTSVLDLDRLILSKLSDGELFNACRINSYIARICSDDLFWMLRMKEKFPHLLNLKDKVGSYRQVYQSFLPKAYVHSRRNNVYIFNDINKAILGASEPDHPLYEDKEKYVYSFAIDGELVGQDVNRRLWIVKPEKTNSKTIPNKDIQTIPPLEADLFVSYRLYDPANQYNHRVAKLTNEKLEELYQLRNSGSNSPGLLLNNEITIHRSDNQVQRTFWIHDNLLGYLTASDGKRSVRIYCIKRDEATKTFTVALWKRNAPWDLLNIEILNSLTWGPLESIKDYLTYN